MERNWLRICRSRNSG